MAPEAEPFMQTPLVIAMPEADGRRPRLPRDPGGLGRHPRAWPSDAEGWAAYGHPEWGPFRLGKTNPNFSTSGLSALIAQAYAATGKTERPVGRGPRQPARPRSSPPGVESAVVHYGDITRTFLNNWYRTDREGTSLTYASAVAVEEKSVIDYNAGNPDGVLDPGERPRTPRIPLVAVYPKEGTLYSDNPFFVLDAAVGGREGAARRPPLRGVHQAAREPAQGAGVRLPPGQPRRGRRPRRSSRPTASTPTSPTTLLEIPRPR